MKFKLQLEAFGTGKTIPINYQYEFSSWIYKTIHFGKPEFAAWLHGHGYMDGNKQFKLFTFSQLQPDKYGIKGDRLELQSDPSLLHISFYAEEAVEPFITGLFRSQEFAIGDKVSKVQFRVVSIEKLPEPIWLTSTMTFRAASPVMISKSETGRSGKAQYLSPEDPDYGELFIKNLLAKYLAVMKQKNNSAQVITFGLSNNMKFTLLGKSRSKVIKIKAGTPAETSLKGYLFDFSMNAPVELLKLGYYAGFGEKNSLGFGSCELLR
jgi:CRISPR-associated endoribonuclease Cas6